MLLNKLTFRPHSGPRFTHALAQNQLSKITSLIQTCCVSHRRQLLFAKSSKHSIIISLLVLKSDMSESSWFSVGLLVIRKPLQPILDSRTRTALTGTLHMLSVWKLLCSRSSSVLYHTNSICVIVNFNYSTGPLNAWIWLAEERSNVCNYFQGNAQRT